MFKILKRLLPYKFKINLRKILNSVLKIRKKIINNQLNLFFRKLFFRKLRYSRGYFLNSDLRKNLHRFLSNKSIQSFLEIGTFEGLASFWINKKYIKNNGSHIIVDPLTDVIDVTTDVDMINEENFYFNLMCEYGYEDIATQIQELYLKGSKLEAEALFPSQLLDDLTLVGSKERIKEKLEDWKNCNVTEISISIPLDIDTIRFVKECM